MRRLELKIMESFIRLNRVKSIYELNSIDIIKDANVSKSGFYSNFKNSHDVLQYLNNFLMDRYYSDILYKIDKLPNGKLTAIKLIFIVEELAVDKLYDDKDFMIELIESNLSYLVYDHITKSLLDYVSRNNGYLSRIYVLGNLVIRNCFAVFEVLMVSKFNASSKEFKDAFYDLSMDSLSNIVK